MIASIVVEIESDEPLRKGIRPAQRRGIGRSPGPALHSNSAVRAKPPTSRWRTSDTVSGLWPGRGAGATTLARAQCGSWRHRAALLRRAIGSRVIHSCVRTCVRRLRKCHLSSVNGTPPCRWAPPWQHSVSCRRRGPRNCSFTRPANRCRLIAGRRHLWQRRDDCRKPAMTCWRGCSTLLPRFRGGQLSRVAELGWPRPRQ